MTGVNAVMTSQVLSEKRVMRAHRSLRASKSRGASAGTSICLHWLRMLGATLLVFAAWVGPAPTAGADPIPPGWQAHNFSVVGYSGVSGFKLALREVGGRWYLYTTSIQGGLHVIDVTDPANPVTLRRIPAPRNTLEIQVTVNGDLMITGMSRTFTTEETSGRVPDPTLAIQPPTPAHRAYSEGLRLWSLSDPANPREVSRWSAGGLGVHRNLYPGGQYAYISTTAPGFRGFFLVILDVSDPANPREVSRWWRPGQRADETPGALVPGFHGPAFPSADGRTLVLPYTPGVVTLDVSDPVHPTQIGALDMVPPIADTGTQSIHTAIPLDDGRLIYFNSESKAPNCNEAWQGAGLIDNSNPRQPQLLSIFPRPQPIPGLSYADFCDKGGRFGPHNASNEAPSSSVAATGDLIYLTYFNAGLRVFDVSNPRSPLESGWFMPPNPARPIQSQVGSLTVNQTQDVLVDTRGYAYITDSAWGIWIVRYTGDDTTNEQ